jgi:hypothetical protein
MTSLNSFGSFWLGKILQASRMAAQCLHWKKVASRFAMSQKPSVDLHSGQGFSDLWRFSISCKFNLSPELFRVRG